MDWPCKKDDIQARYFFGGVQTHLCVYAEAGYVTWVFQFQDFKFITLKNILKKFMKNLKNDTYHCKKLFLNIQ